MYRRRLLSSASVEKIDANKYLTIEAAADLTVSFTNTCEYCIDSIGVWYELSSNSTISIKKNQTLSFRGNLTPVSSNAAGIGTFNVSGSFNLTGNCMSMLFGDAASTNKSLSGKAYAFSKLFSGCKNLKTVSQDFLPATTLANSCYSNMFLNCSSLTNAPKLPATTLTYSGYYNMFSGCSSLSTAPALPATTLGSYCYKNMFFNCTSLKTASTLPATTLASYCYTGMFEGCTGLTTAPELPAETLETDCYYRMFYGCTGLTTAPELPAETLTTYCYTNMFYGCTGLTEAPTLPATTLASYCYNGMFEGCTGLTTAPELPAETLANYCYYRMFYGCTGLTKAPTLPAKTLKASCYGYMFQNCSNLNYIKMLSTTTPSTSYTNNWVSGVASTGTFVKNSEATWNVVGVHGVPTGWTIETSSFLKANYLTIESLEDELTIQFKSSSVGDCYYCIGDTGDWETLPKNNTAIPSKSIKKGQTLSIKGNLTPLENKGIGSFTINKKANLSGNCMSMLFGDLAITNKSLNGKNYAFYNLFYNCTKLQSVITKTFLPATTLSNSCYKEMFYGCTSLTSAPNLSATTLKSECYQRMFYGCTSLTTAPTLSGKNLAYACYHEMFYGCESLTTAPTLSATKLADYCYEEMFYGCTSLTSAPALPATTLTVGCYSGMFYGCTSLTTAPTLSATTLADYCYEEMFCGCESLTTAPALPATTLTEGCYSGMFSYCTSLTSAPDLPAETLATLCYYYMFYGCSNLNYIKILALDISALYCLDYWATDVAYYGTLVRYDEATWSLNGTSELPDGWSWNEILDLEKYLTIEILEDNTAISCQPDGSTFLSVYFSVNGHLGENEWLKISDRGGTVYNLNTGDKVSFKQYYYYNNDYGFLNYVMFAVHDNNNFNNHKPFKVIGNCNSMCLDSSNYTSTQDYYNGPMVFNNLEDCPRAFKKMFYNCTKLQSVSENLLPATKLSEECYSNMFYGCTGLIKAPNLPATTLADKCYSGMFEGCAELTSMPNLPATSLKEYCYNSMFKNCIKLVNVSDLPATSLKQYCYYSMFDGCTALKTAPVLPAPTLANYCYYSMFYNCNKLNYIKMLAKSEQNYSLISWVYNVASTGTFVKHKNATFLDRGISGIPEGWTLKESYNTPSIFKSSTGFEVEFNNNDGIYRPNNVDNILTFSSSVLLSMQPSCDINVDIFYPNTTTLQELYKTNRRWRMTKTLSSFLEEIYQDSTINKTTIINKIAIKINSIYDINDSEYYN